MLREHNLTVSDHDAWRAFLPESRSVFGSLGYARICNTFRKAHPHLYVVESDGAAICYPLLLRPMSDLAFPATETAKWDSSTPDFTGPLLRGFDHRMNVAFPNLCHAFFQINGIVSEFAHLHPWSDARDLLDSKSIVHNRDIVWVDLTLDPEVLWSDHFHHSCRKNIATAERAGVKIISASTDEYITEFCRIYDHTMRRNRALEGYHFSPDFFFAFRNELPAHARFLFAEYRDQIIAATLYLHDDTDVYSFLGGADADFQSVRPTNAVVWETIRWAHRAGKKRLILGGGYKPEDGIFRFKATFSRLRRAFHVYKSVHLGKDYDVLERRFRDYHGLADETLNYFPSYRQPQVRGCVSQT
jgi:hypothetical protein